MTTFECSFISNKAEPEDKGFYKWVGVKVEFCYHHELQSDVGMKSYWLGSVSSAQPLMRQNGPHSIKLRKEKWDKELGFYVIISNSLWNTLPGTKLRKRNKHKWNKLV